jgi:sulfotransferase
MRKIHYISGLPRSGSTLLTNILLQNPKIQTTATSSLLEFMLQVRDNWTKLEGHTAHPDGQDKWAVIQSIMQTYHKTDKQIIIDLYQGESSFINENIHIKSFELKNINSGNPVIYITIKVN